MQTDIDALKKLFRDGHHSEAIDACEALCAQPDAGTQIKRLCANMHAMVGRHARALELLHQLRNPAREDADVLFNIAMCERALKNFDAALQYFGIYTRCFPASADGWIGMAECKFDTGHFKDGVAMADRAIKLDPQALPAWVVRADCQKALGRFEDALASYKRASQMGPDPQIFHSMGEMLIQAGKPADAIASFGEAIRRSPGAAKPLVARGDAWQILGRSAEAASDYGAALTITPEDAEVLKKATLCLLDLGQADEALRLCRDIVKKHPDNLTARLGAEWVASQLVPLWHIPMMNEPERNHAYHEGLRATIAPGHLVFEIGTGSGLLAMMAAQLGAGQVVTCEAVGLLANTAKTIVARNGLDKVVTVLSKPSQEVQIGTDLPDKADVLVHEIFSSELLGEHVLPAIEDAKRRLLKPGGVLMPRAASIVVALVTGERIGRNVYAGESFGFDLRDFNAIYPRKHPLYREDLHPELMSSEVEAFGFDFMLGDTFPAESRTFPLTVTKAGTCWGILQWIRVRMAEDLYFENHPSMRGRDVANWQLNFYGFEAPLQLREGEIVEIRAMHDRARPWFELASAHVGRGEAEG